MQQHAAAGAATVAGLELEPGPEWLEEATRRRQPQAAAGHGAIRARRHGARARVESDRRPWTAIADLDPCGIVVDSDRELDHLALRSRAAGVVDQVEQRVHESPAMRPHQRRAARTVPQLDAHAA